MSHTGLWSKRDPARGNRNYKDPEAETFHAKECHNLTFWQNHPVYAAVWRINKEEQCLMHGLGQDWVSFQEQKPIHTVSS